MKPEPTWDKQTLLQTVKVVENRLAHLAEKTPEQISDLDLLNICHANQYLDEAKTKLE